MFKSRALTGALFVGAVAVASLFAASPANAAPLPAGQKITVVEWETWQFFDANSVDATLIPVGTPGELPIGESVEAVDVNDDGQGYAVTTTYVEPEPEPCEEEFCPLPDPIPSGATLYKADAIAGTLSEPIPVTILTNEGPVFTPADECLALDYTDGVITVACDIFDQDDASAWIGNVDPDTAKLVTDTALFNDDFVRFEAIAISPIDGMLWVTDGWTYGTLVLGEAPISVGYSPMFVWGADFDRDGQLWVSVSNPDEPADRVIDPGEDGLAILNLAEGGGSFTFNAAWSDQEAEINAITVWGKQTLPATGSADLSAPITAAALLLLAGTILAGVTVLRRREARG
jgi:hypothetical protein